MELKDIIYKFIFSIVSFVLMSILLPFLMDGVLLQFLPLEDQEAHRMGREASEKLNHHLPPGEYLTTHESQVAANVIFPEGGINSIGGLKPVKDELLHHVITPLRNYDVFFHSKKMCPPRGILFEGPPGTGKTILAKAVAAEAGVPLLLLSLSSIENKYVGESQKLLSSTFSLAKKLQPCIIFIDEIDSIVRQRSMMDQAHDYGLKTTLLQLMDGAGREDTDAVIVIAATNNSQILDDAIRRRLPRKYTITYPSPQGRREILNILTSEESESYPNWLIKRTRGKSGSDLKCIYEYASAVRNEEIAKDPSRIEQIRMDLEYQHTDTFCIPILEKHWQYAIDRMDDNSDAE